MRKQERNALRLLAGIIACINLPVFDAVAQSYPVKPIRMLVGFSPGGGTDVTARMVAQKLSEPLGQPMVIENRAGASGSIATEMVATSPADGYTLLFVTGAETAIPALRAKLPYDLERDFAPVSLVAIVPYLLVVHPSIPARDVSELIALARLRPGKLSYSSSGVGSTAHFAAALFNIMAKVNIVHVPYKGASEAVIANVAGHIEMSFLTFSTAEPFLKSGKLRPLAVTTTKRTSLLPSLPTLGESGLPLYERSTWYGVLTPAGAAKDIIARLNAAIGKVVNIPELQASLHKLGFEPQTSTPEQFAAFIRDEIAKNATLIKSIGLKAE